MTRHKLLNINSIETNFKAEVIASLLTGENSDTDNILIVRRKGDKRGVSKDVNEITSHYSAFDMMEYVYIYTNRKGIYDSLPEGLFHQPASTRKQRTKDDIIHEIRNQRIEENWVRKFFQPFEIALDRIVLETQVYEQKYDKAYFYPNLTDIVKEQWTILPYLSPAQALLFIKIIPVLAEVSRDLDLTAKVMSILLDCPVSIKEEGKSSIELAYLDRVKLKNWKLGVSSVLGKSASYENLDLVIQIGPLSLEKMKLFESKQKNNLIVNELINLMIPFDRNTVIKYQTLKSETKFRLSGKGHTAYLGVNTTL